MFYEYNLCCNFGSWVENKGGGGSVLTPITSDLIEDIPELTLD